MLEMVVIKNQISTVLREKGMTPYGLAKMLGKHSNHVYKLARRENLDDISIKTMVDVANALGVPVESLYTVEPN